MSNEYRAEIIDLNKENIDPLAELITDAFLSDEAAQKEGTTIVFDATMLQRLFASPYLNDQLIIRVVHQQSNNLVGFMGGLPRDICLNDMKSKEKQKIRLMVPSWAAVHPDHKRKGIGSLMVSKFIEEVSKRGYTHSYAIFEPEQNGKDLGYATSKKNTEINTVKWFDINWFIIRIFDIPAVNKVMKLTFYEKWAIRMISPPHTPGPKALKKGKVRLFEPRDKLRIFELIDEYSKTKNAAVIKDKMDLDWYLDQPGIVCCVHEDNQGKVNGFVLGWKFNFAGFGNMIPFGWLDLINIDHLSARSATQLIRYFTIEAKKKGWKGIQTPYIPYFSITPFLRSKFLPFPKKMFVQIFGFKNAEMSFFKKKPKSCFLDWR